MRKILNEKQIASILHYYDDKVKGYCWEVTDDKSIDPIRSESDDEFYPYVILIDGNFFDAITSDFYNELMEEE